ncbi:MAG: hypothetical protein IT310_06740 [Anaerolineales bacterium]|nr:hypothetical protein [Anaerolineales bacterium]
MSHFINPAVLTARYFPCVTKCFFFFANCARGVPTVCVTCVWAGVDSVWEQKKLEAWKMLENAAESHTSGVSMKAQSDGVAVGHVFG